MTREAAPLTRVASVVFDLGGVLVDWDPRYLYRSIFDDETEMERFLAEVCSMAWNATLDAGRPWDEAVEALTREHPRYAREIAAYRDRVEEMLAGQIDGTVGVLAEVKAAGMPVFALSNWSAHTFPLAQSRFEFLSWFDAIVLSGELGICKPDPRIFHHLLERHGLEAGTTAFIDDSAANVAAACELGMLGLRFVDPGTLRSDLAALGVPLATD